VLVGAGEEIDVVAVEPHEAGDGVGRDRLIGVADMRRAVRVGDRGGDVEGGFGRHRDLFLIRVSGAALRKTVRCGPGAYHSVQ